MHFESLRAAVVAALVLAVPAVAFAQDVGLEPDQRAQLAAAAFDADALERVTWSDDRDAPQFLAGDLGAVSAPAEFYADNAQALGFVADPEVRVVRSETDDLGLTHVRVQQTVAGVPVWGAESAVHLRDGRVYAWGGAVHPDADAVATVPALTERAALEAARRDIGDVPLRASVPADALAESIDWSPTAELVVYPHDDAYRLAYHVRVFVDQPVPANWETFVDAQSGEVLHRFNSLHTAGLGADAHGLEAGAWSGAPYARTSSRPMVEVMDGPANGTGSSLFGGTLPLATFLYQGAYYLYDTTRGPQYIRTMSSNGGNSLPGQYVTDSNNSFSASAAVDAHYGAVTTFDYFKNTHGRSSYNGSNATITSTVNYDDQPGGAGYNNAFWNGQQMVYGDGDGQTFRPLVSLDIAAHELTHAVTGTSAGLIYQNESGALNEAVSDIFAVMVDRNDFLIGEDSYTPGRSGDALRYMDDPSRGNQPDNYADRYTGSQDNGGVHINSGIANKQAYLMIAGGTFRGVAVQSVGRSVTEKVWYRALTRYFTQSTNFAGARQGTIQAATDLYGAGSAQVRSVTNAWAAVGVGSAAGGGGGGDNGGGGTPEWRYENRVYQSPHNYPNNYNATNTYTKAGASRVAMYFERFDTEANYDFVNILDESGTRQARYTGRRSAFWAVVDGSSISANLTSDYSVTRYGYRVSRVAYFSDRPLLVGGGEEGEPLGFEPVPAPSDVAASSAVKVEELALEVGPNPAQGAATAIVSLPEAGAVSVTVIDLLGREVLSSRADYGQGRHSVALDTARLPAGAYVVVLEAEGERLTRRLTVVR